MLCYESGIHEKRESSAGEGGCGRCLGCQGARQLFRRSIQSSVKIHLNVFIGNRYHLFTRYK